VTSGGSISCADQIDRVSDPEWPLRAAQFLKPPALPGDTYSVAPELPAQPNPPTVRAAAANTAPPQPAPPAQTAPEGVAPTTAALSPGEPQLLQSMARDLATVGQEIEQLKASTEQLKASQEQMSRDIAKAPVQNLRPKISAPPPRSAAALARKRMPPFPPPQIRSSFHVAASRCTFRASAT
jgi:hypothetical protein